MNTHIRKALISDAEAICELNREEMGYTLSIENTQERLIRILGKDTDRVFVFVVEDKVVGYIHACDYELLYATPMKNIIGIAVAKDYQRKGIGKALFAQIAAWAKETGATGVRLTSGEERLEAHGFYKKLGFTKSKNQIKFTKYFTE